MPAVYVLHLAAAVRMCGGSDAALLADAGQTSEALSDPEARMSYSRFAELAERAVQISGEPGLGFVLGATAPISRFGSLGFAVLASATLFDALRAVERYMPIITNICQYRLSTTDQHAVLELQERIPLGSARELVVGALTTAVWRLGEQLTGHRLPADAEFAFSKPCYFERFATAAERALCRFDAERHQVRFDRHLLDLPILSADPAAARRALQQCERELSALAPSPTLIEQISVTLQECGADGWPTPKQLAKQLGLAERTLKRRLSEHGTSYTQLLDSVRQRRAMAALRTEASVDDIAAELGYSDAANFTRAFRRWTGRSPSTFRRGAR